MTLRSINADILAAIAKVQASLKPDGALIYGSYATGVADELSDVDVLFTIHTGKESHGYVEECGFWLDYKCLTRSHVREDLDQDHTNNHVPIMNALVEGVIVLDRD